MPSLFTTRFEDVAMPMLENQLGFSVVFKVGATSSAAFTALATDREYEAVELETGLQFKLTSRDWLLPASSLVISGALVVPRAGHRIVDGSDEYEIVPIAGKPAVEKQEYRYLCHSQWVTA
jgi:hypothetical protein